MFAVSAFFPIAVFVLPVPAASNAELPIAILSAPDVFKAALVPIAILVPVYKILPVNVISVTPVMSPSTSKSGDCSRAPVTVKLPGIETSPDESINIRFDPNVADSPLALVLIASAEPLADPDQFSVAIHLIKAPVSNELPSYPLNFCKAISALFIVVTVVASEISKMPVLIDKSSFATVAPVTVKLIGTVKSPVLPIVNAVGFPPPLYDVNELVLHASRPCTSPVSAAILPIKEVIPFVASITFVVSTLPVTAIEVPM